MRRNPSALLVVLVFAAWACVWVRAAPRLRTFWKEEEALVYEFSPDGRLLVSSNAEGFQLRDVESGRVIAVLTTRPVWLSGQVFSPDGRLLFAQVSSDEHRPVPVADLKVWDVATGQARARIPYIQDDRLLTDHFVLSPDGKFLATLDNSERLPMQVKTSKIGLGRHGEFEVSHNASPGLSRVTLWNVPEWKMTAMLDAGLPMVFSPDGTALATGSRDGRVRGTKVWDTANGKLRDELVEKMGWGKPFGFSPDGKFLLIGSSEEKSLCEIASRENWAIPASRSLGERPVFSRDGILLFPNGLPRTFSSYANNTEFPCYDLSALPPRRLDLGDGHPPTKPLRSNAVWVLISPSLMGYAAFSPTDAWDQHTVTLRDLPNRRVTGQLTVQHLHDAAFVSGGRWFALLVNRRHTIPPRSEVKFVLEIQLIDPVSAKLLATIPLPAALTSTLRGWKFSPDGNALAVCYASSNGIVRSDDPKPIDTSTRVEIWEVAPQ